MHDSMEGSCNSRSRSFFSAQPAIAVLLCFAFFADISESGSAARNEPFGGGWSSTNFIKRSCEATRYPELCFSSLLGYASAIRASPKHMARAALSVSLNDAKSALTMISELSTEAGLKPREMEAMRDCVDNVGDSVDELKRSIGEMGQMGQHGSNYGIDFEMHISNIQTWVSAALTDEDTCMDGFAGSDMNGDLKNRVKARIVKVEELTSNALALVNVLAPKQKQGTERI